jgi:hypothetical protein
MLAILTKFLCLDGKFRPRTLLDVGFKYVPTKSPYLPTIPRGITTQKTHSNMKFDCSR